MKKVLFVLMSAIMVLTMLLATCASVAAATPNRATPDDSPQIDAERAEYLEYLKNNVTTDNEFVDNEVLVFLYETEDPYDYTLETFAEYGVIGLKRSEYNEYFLVLTLDKHDKQNVLDITYALYDIPGIYFAHPNFLLHMDPPIEEVVTPTETVSATETSKPATPDKGQPSKTNSNSVTAQGGNAVATGDNDYIYFIVFLMIAALLGAIAVRFRKA